MKKICLLSAILLLSAGWLMAQSTTSSSSSTSGTEHSMNKTMRGCLGGSAGSYTLTETSGKEFNLRGDSAQLAEHLGQEVRITGEETKAPASTSTTSQSASSTSNPTLEVSKVEKVAATCSTATK
jgi:hypothetical protein